MRTKQVHGFATGDIVRAVVPKGKKTGTYTGRVAVRASGSFNIQAAGTVVQGISWKHCRVLQRADGYGYTQVASATRVKGRRIPPPPEGRGFLRCFDEKLVLEDVNPTEKGRQWMSNKTAIDPLMSFAEDWLAARKSKLEI